METVLSLCVGIGLSAACGFRVFVPLLLMSIASYTGHLTLGSGFDWIGSQPALIAFSVATALEIGGYYVPWLDHLLDTVSTPAAIVAGTVITASFVTDLSPFLRWTLAVVAGGGAAGLVQGSTVLLRGGSTLVTGGLGNPVFATAELAGSLVVTAFSFLAPIATVAFLILGAVLLGRRLILWRTNKPA